jgi:Glycosyl hydrolases family 16
VVDHGLDGGTPLRLDAKPDVVQFDERASSAIGARGMKRILSSFLIAFAASLSPAAAASPSGKPMPVGHLPGWHQIFTDDFNRPVPVGGYPSHQNCGGRVYPASKWCPYPDGTRDTSGIGTYMPSRVMSNHDGILDLHLRTAGRVRMVAAPQAILPNAPTLYRGQRYGRYVVRFRADPLPCYKTAWLLWPDSGVWPRDGEIDFPEGELDQTISGFVHFQNGTSGSDQYGVGTGATYTRWHTAVIVWLPNLVRFNLDGRIIGQVRKRIPNKPMHWVLQTETSCWPARSTAGHVRIDWVAIYKPS